MGAISQKSAEFLLRSRIADAETGDVDALFELGVTYSTGRGGLPVDLVEAHKWFNLAALSGCTRGQECRAEIALEKLSGDTGADKAYYEGKVAAAQWFAQTNLPRLAAELKLAQGVNLDVMELDEAAF